MVAGIIAEYNPFHAGHAYQIQKIKQDMDADAVIVAMSGEFTQRGIPAIVSKYERSRMALLQGADVILEIPAVFATSGAFSYAMAGVTTLMNTGITDTLVFGSEQPDMELFERAASLLSHETPDFQTLIQKELSDGSTYAAARAKALSAEGIPADFLRQPNNILGIEYVRAIRSLCAPLTPIAIRRVGSGYHETRLDARYPSATALRRALAEDLPPQAINGLPASSREILSRCQEDAECIFPNDLSLPLHQRLLQGDTFARYADCTEELARRIDASLDGYRDFESFCDALKTRNITHARVSRSLCHILLDITGDDVAAAQNVGYVPYLRLLGFSQRGAALLPAIKRQSAVPVITAAADAAKILPPEALAVFQKDIHAADIYRSIRTNKSKRAYPTEYTRKFDLAYL